MPTRARRYDMFADSLPGLGRDPASVRRRVEMLERLLESAFVIPGTNRRIGLDVLLNIVPIGGDIVGAMLGLWLIHEARGLGLSRWQIARMVGNVAIDAGLGAVPWIGAIPDYLFRSNSRNLAIIRRHLDRHHPETATVEARG